MIASAPEQSGTAFRVGAAGVEGHNSASLIYCFLVAHLTRVRLGRLPSSRGKRRQGWGSPSSSPPLSPPPPPLGLRHPHVCLEHLLRLQNRLKPTRICKRN